MKFANKRVNGWNNRHIEMLKVLKALQTRVKNGFTLMSDEKQFMGDTISLLKRYN